MFEPEKAILVGVKTKSQDDYSFNSSFSELKGLIKADGGTVIGELIQSKNYRSASTYMGKGKLEELKHLVSELEPDLVVFDGELTPNQMKNLQVSLDLKIVDRTMLILDIFSQRARSNEGKLQVELANLEYQLPRLAGRGKEMSRTAGGIGTRGLGEQKLELDRRYLRRRIQEIKGQMEKARKTRELHRTRRHRAGLETVSLVGYTNAGKSSLFNCLCRMAHNSRTAQVEADDRLFQTLDTTVRKIYPRKDQPVLISDSVGFIQNLPHALVAAFRSTLEEAVDADLLLHVVDISDPEYMEKMRVVEEVLEDLGANKGKILTVYNKADLLPDWNVNNPNNFVSALQEKGIEELIFRISEMLEQPEIKE